MCWDASWFLRAIEDGAGGTSKTKFCCITKPLVLFVRVSVHLKGAEPPAGPRAEEKCATHLPRSIKLKDETIADLKRTDNKKN